MSKRILILIGGHLSTAPRAQKEARALMEAGYDVEVRGVWFDEGAVAEDLAMMARTGIHFAPALDFCGGSLKRLLHRVGVRMRARLAREKFRWAGRPSPDLLGYGACELLAAAVRHRADLTIVHSEAGLWVGREMLRQGFRVGIDFEDWFSRDLPAAARAARPVPQLTKLEQAVARDARYVLAPSRAMASALARSYSIPRPDVIYNSFSWTERATMDELRKDRRNVDGLSVHWFSQHIGPDRGLELLFAALPLLHPGTHVYLRGACSEMNRRWMSESIPKACCDQVTILPLVSSTQLLSRIAEHDIGLALETSEIESRNLSVSNKVFHYLQAGLAVIATNTQGQREVLEQCSDAAFLLPEASPHALAEKINFYAANPVLLARAKEASLHAAKSFDWNLQKGALLKAAARALFDGGEA